MLFVQNKTADYNISYPYCNCSKNVYEIRVQKYMSLQSVVVWHLEIILQMWYFYKHSILQTAYTFKLNQPLRNKQTSNDSFISKKQSSKHVCKVSCGANLVYIFFYKAGYEAMHKLFFTKLGMKQLIN